MSKDLDFSSRIIYEVQKYPVIWDSRHPHHLNRQILGNAWYSISTILQKPENLCKQRWRSLKERYQKSIRAVQQSGGDRELAAIKTSSNSFFEQLSFLQSNSADANIPDNREDMSESVTATAFDSERLSKPNPIELDEELNTESPPFSPSNTSQSESNGPKPKKSKQQVEIVEKSILQRKKQVRNEDDEVSSYARYLSLAISTLKPKNQLLVRHKFEEILFEVKMSELEEQQCGQISTSSTLSQQSSFSFPVASQCSSAIGTNPDTGPLSFRSGPDASKLGQTLKNGTSLEMQAAPFQPVGGHSQSRVSSHI